jgi:hypothetical protein
MMMHVRTRMPPTRRSTTYAVFKFIPHEVILQGKSCTATEMRQQSEGDGAL